jgi:pyrroloquinoline quinone biosynthesis protein D
MLMPAQIADGARPRLARGVRLQVDETTGQSVLLFPEGILELNETAREIITRCDGRSLSDIAHALSEDYDMDLATLSSDVRETVADLQRRKLVELS